MPVSLPASMLDTQRLDLASTGSDALAVPFDLRAAVDLLLDDLGTMTPVATQAHTPGLAAERSAHRAAAATRRSGGGRAVLVVDRSAIARKFLMQRLDGLGYRARGADSGEQAMAMIQQEPFAIVFLEFLLGSADGLDGLGLCQAIKQKSDPPCGRVPAVVMVTGRVGSSDRVRGALAGCDHYLTKPLGEASFTSALADVDPLFR